MTDRAPESPESPEAGEAAKARWAELSVRRRGALIRAVRRGDRVGEADRALAVVLAERELARLATVVRPGRVSVWRVLHAAAAALLGLGAAASFAGGRTTAGAVLGALAVVFGSSALLARRRLDRQVARLARARDANA